MSYENEIWKQIKVIPLLTKEEEIELGKRINKGDKKAEEKLVYHNLRLVFKEARKYSKQSQRAFEDVYQDGVLGLIKAASKFDVERKRRFSTMAIHWINNSMQKEKYNTEDTIRKPQYQEEFYYQIKRKRRELISILGYEPDEKEIALAMNVKEEKIIETLNAFQNVSSLNKKVEDGENELGDFIESKKDNIEERVLNEIEKEEIKKLLKETLTEREIDVIENRFGLNGEVPKTLESVGKCISITKEGIRKIEKRALEKLKEKVEKKDTSLEHKQEESTYLDILSAYQDYNLDSFINIYKGMYESLDTNSMLLLHKFFKEKPIKTLTKKELENVELEINTILLTEKSENRIALFLLEEYFDAHIEKFTPRQIDVIEKYILKRKRGFIENKGEKVYAISLYKKLERMYLKVDNIGKINFEKEQIVEVLKENSTSFSQIELFILYKHYGIECEEKSYEEIGKILNMTPTAVRDKFHKVRLKAIHLYLGIVNKIEEDLSIYIPYIKDVQYEMTKETRQILTYFIIDHLSYEEIKDKMSISTERLSNIIKDGLRKIDYYRFKITVPLTFTREKLEKFYKESKRTYSSREKEIIEKRYFEGKTVDEIPLEMNVDKKEINSIFRKFSNEMVLFEIPLIENIEFVKKEINKKPIDSILTDEEKSYISLLYGIQNRWNKQGKQYEAREVALFKSVKTTTVFVKKREIIKKLRLAQVGKLFPTFGRIPSKRLEELLKDHHIPLKKDDIELLQNILKIGLETENIIEILQKQTMTTMGEKSIKRKYQRAIVLLKKYEKGEIEPELSFEKEIIPNLKYFSEYEQKLLNLLYKEEKSAPQIAHIFKKSVDEIRRDIDKVKITLYSILKKKNIVNLYPFEDTKKIIEKGDFYLGENHDLFIQIYQLYYGEGGNVRYTLPQIKEKLNLPYSIQQLYNFLIYTLVTIQKYKYGFFIKPIIEKEDIKNYYEKQKENLPKSKLKTLSYYLKKSSLFYYNIAPSLQIEILKEADKLPFSFAKTTKKEVLELLKNPLLEITDETRNILYAYYEIKGREIMTLDEKQELAQVLTPFYKEYKVKKYPPR